jgi:hypothetical protein
MALSKRATKIWLDRWCALYAVASDAPLAPLAGRASFGHADLTVIYEWKFRRYYPGKKIKALTARSTDVQARDWTRRAISNTDDLAALRLAGLLPGCAPAGASAVLMVADPQRFTVMNKRAIKSLVYHELWDTAAQGSGATYERWLEYLQICRRLSTDHAMTLREIDRALWQAEGRP